MNWYRAPDGSERIWFDVGEIEGIAEGELRKAALLPTLEAPSVDIERFIEGHLSVRLDQYADLDPDVLGVTQYRPGLPPEIRINRDLTNTALDTDEGTPGLRGRWRATLAHEASHVMLHEVLFDLNPDQGRMLDGDSGGSRLMRCLKREVTFTQEGRDWREVQANRGMAALLMPQSVFIAAARQEFERLGLGLGPVVEGSAESQEVAATLANRSEVSRQAARIRLATLGLASPPSQALLGSQ